MAIKLIIVFIAIYAIGITLLILRDQKNGTHFKRLSLISWMFNQEKDQIEMPEHEMWCDKIKH